MRDLAIQEREDDLVLATFGRGFYVLDDFTPLRQRDAPACSTRTRRCSRCAGAACSSRRSRSAAATRPSRATRFYTAPNPPFGAVFTYYLKDEIKTRKKQRQEAEKKLAEKGGGRPRTRPGTALAAEDREEDPAIVLTSADATGNVVRRLTGPVTAGFHRVAWDLRYPPPRRPRSKAVASLDPWVASAWARSPCPAATR